MRRSSRGWSRWRAATTGTGLRQWWDAVFGAMPDYTVEIVELRDLDPF
jgi:hypothetical protein